MVRFIKKASGYILTGLMVGVLCTHSVVHSFQKREADALRSIGALDDGSIEQDVIIEYIYKRLVDVSELSVVEFVYNNTIPCITKDDIFMIYTGTVRAGIDASLVRIDITDDDVLIVLPESEILSIHVETDSVQFYGDETDVRDAISIAEEDLKDRVDADSILSRATDEVRYMIKELLKGRVGGRNIVFMQEG